MKIYVLQSTRARPEQMQALPIIWAPAEEAQAERQRIVAATNSRVEAGLRGEYNLAKDLGLEADPKPDSPQFPIGFLRAPLVMAMRVLCMKEMSQAEWIDKRGRFEPIAIHDLDGAMEPWRRFFFALKLPPKTESPWFPIKAEPSMGPGVALLAMELRSLINREFKAWDGSASAMLGVKGLGKSKLKTKATR